MLIQTLFDNLKAGKIFVIWSVSETNVKNLSPREFQDGGGVGGRGVHLSLQMHQEYIYRCNGSHRTPAKH